MSIHCNPVHGQYRVFPCVVFSHREKPVFITGKLFSHCTLLLFEGIPRALKGKKLCLKNPLLFPSIFWVFLVFQIWGQNKIGGQFLKHYHLIWYCLWFLKRWWMFLTFQIWGQNTLKFWLKVPAEGKCPHILILITSKN